MANEEEVRAAEARLGLRLPSSYRASLLHDATLPGDHGMKLLSAAEIDSFARRELEWLAAWLEGIASVPKTPGTGLPDDPTDPATMPSEELGGTLVISTTGDMRLLLLNPARIKPDGEWEAWDFASWYPGAYRYPSFSDLINALASVR